MNVTSVSFGRRYVKRLVTAGVAAGVLLGMPGQISKTTKAAPIPESAKPGPTDVALKDMTCPDGFKLSEAQIDAISQLPSVKGKYFVPAKHTPTETLKRGFRVEEAGLILSSGAKPYLGFPLSQRKERKSSDDATVVFINTEKNTNKSPLTTAYVYFKEKNKTGEVVSKTLSVDAHGKVIDPFAKPEADQK